jgi:fatty-acyl-CoA synthase
VGLAHERWIEAIAAVVVAREQVSAQELIAFARERLAAHKVPKSVHFVDELPKNASGKLLKRELRDRLSAPAAAPMS